MMKILAADVGGTHSRFAWFDAVSPSQMTMTDAVWLQTGRYPSFANLLEGFLASDAGRSFSEADTAVFAVAGPVEDGVYCRPPNIDWDIDLNEIRRRFDMPPTTLINDFAAQAFACRSPVMQDAQQVLPGNIVDTAPLVAIGAGTGLGIAGLIPATGGGYRALPSEGGHTAFAFENESEFELQRFLAADTGEPYVRAETVVSGSGLGRIHHFLTGQRREPADIAADSDRNSDTLQWMAGFLGRLCRQCALQYMAAGGIYVTGGVAAKIPRLVTHPEFGRSFYRSATMLSILQGIPVFLNRNEDSGLWGAALCGWQQQR